MKTDQDCVQLHAWLSVFLKGKGAFSEFVNGEHEKLRVKEQMELLTAKEAETLHRALRILDEYEQGMKSERISAVDAQNAWLRAHFQELVNTRQQCVEVLHHALSRAFSFTEDCFGREQEMILLVTGLTRNDRAMEFIRLCAVRNTWSSPVCCCRRIRMSCKDRRKHCFGQNRRRDHENIRFFQR